MSLRQNIANAVRQSSLAKSTRMGDLLHRFEHGRPCMNPDDIDFLIDEIVKRIEERLLSRLAQLPELLLERASEGEEPHTAATKLPKRPPCVLRESTLRHQARLLVDQVLRVVTRHLRLVGPKRAPMDERASTRPGGTVWTSSEHRAPRRDGDTNICPRIVKRYNDAMPGKRAEPGRPAEMQRSAPRVVRTERAPADRRLPPGDVDPARTAATYALRKAAKTSLRRYSVTGNVNALMLAGEWAMDDGRTGVVSESIGVTAKEEPASKTVTTPIHQDVNILLASSGDSDKVPRNGVQGELGFVHATPRKQAPTTTRGLSQVLNSSFTYARRAEIKKSLPKFLASSSREAMMTMFNAIRVAMAEEEIETLDYAGLLATLVDRSRDGKDLPQQAAEPKAIFRQQPSKGSSLERKTEAKQRYGRLPDSEEPSKAYDTSRDRLSARQQNFSTLGTYTLRKATRSRLSHMLQKGSSYNALLVMACNLRNGQTDEQFWDEALDMDLDETTRKEVISDLAELSRQARDGTPQESFPGEPRASFPGGWEEDKAERKAVASEAKTPGSGTYEDQRYGVYSRSGVRRGYHTNYTYGIHRGLRRMLPKFTAGRPYAALMHYADSMIADVYEEMIRTGQLEPVPLPTICATATEPRVGTEKVTRLETRYIKPVAAIADRRSVATQTAKAAAKTDNEEELFHDAYSWVARDSSGKYHTPGEEQRCKGQALPAESDDDTLYRSVEDADEGEEYFPAAAQQEATASGRDEGPLDGGTEAGLWLTVEENDDADETKRSVRFADGINPGDTDAGQDQPSAFFQKLGYYERVGSGELLHRSKENGQHSARSNDGEISQAGPERDEHDEPRQRRRAQEKTAERPLSEEAPQQTEETAKPSYACNCL